MPTTAKNHFDDDISRAISLNEKAKALQVAGDNTQLPMDIRGAAIAMAVGSLDAYFCDKYVDCLTKALQEYSSGNWIGVFPAIYRKQLLPAGAVLDASRPRRPKWGIRMAARSVMERENMYSLSRIDDAFNGILPVGQKLWLTIVPQLVAVGKRRFTTHLAQDLAQLSGKSLDKANQKVVATVKARIGITVQFRHDWIHNCARPKGTIINYTDGEAKAAINEIKSLVEILEKHIEEHRIV